MASNHEVMCEVVQACVDNWRGHKTFARETMSEGVHPPFSPRIYDDGGWFYADGRVFGAVDVWESNGVRGLTISEWSSYFPGEGHTKQALRWLREQGFERIVANGVGLIEDGVRDISTAYWENMHAQGLVDVLLDDEGQDITPTLTQVASV